MLLISLQIACFVQEDPELFSLPLTDVNETSSTFSQEVSLTDFAGSISLWYFGHATWGYCSSQFGLLNDIQNELNADPQYAGSIFIIGVNHIDKSNGNESITADRDLPWLQDVADVGLWEQWGVEYRDVYLVGADSTYNSQYNLSALDLTNDDNKQTLIDALTTLAEDSIAP